ncbi:ANTAR domain-containing response regulator [Sinanaerobacter chloroacetimidivorans]|uniref:Stage 0 sporulation protein A homolog n=1 Tax=Sinanaerobacter chloroacetimidivorans TaxID=2818044 RepID=A0A8J8B2J1_9FIRM|nr:response regulator [Sinanaerobacter chloroacetimidivorans]MBR0599873.1 response regulator [Sinanaerobacter chloroacetimidivorans]
MGYLSVLLADDEALTRLDMREHLTKEGHIVCAETGNGLEVLELARMTNPNIALLDIKMPGLDGIDVANQLKGMGIPTVLITAYHQTGLINRAEKVGVFGYLNKPIRQEDIIPALQIAYGRWNDMQNLSKKIESYKERIDNQKKLSIAKGIYALENGISEYEAHKEILKEAMSSRKPLLMICDQIIKKNIAKQCCK